MQCPVSSHLYHEGGQFQKDWIDQQRTDQAAKVLSHQQAFLQEELSFHGETGSLRTEYTLDGNGESSMYRVFFHEQLHL